mgnify:CR=1 FL=1
MKTIPTPLTLVDAIVPRRGLLWDVALVLGFACLTALCAQISFWIGPVPISGQTFAVLLCGALLGSKRGALSQLSYLTIGATGIPFWFALGGTPGIARLIGPTGGYLFGFVIAAFVVGWLAERGWDRHVWSAIVAMFAGSIVIYLVGLSWLSFYIPKDKLLQAGLYPFVIGDLVKIVLAAVLLPSGWLISRKFTH